jgi:molecular chaperone DnaK (HSP70)
MRLRSWRIKVHGFSSSGTTIAIDFGNSTTKIAICIGQSPPSVVPVRGLSREITCSIDPPVSVSVIPSLIRYSSNGAVYAGAEALDHGNSGGNDLIRWMVHYIAVGSPARVRVMDSFVSYQEAGETFLSQLLARICEQYRITSPGLVIAVPAGAYDHFDEWVSGFATRNGYSRIRLIDEPTAAALRCCPDIGPGEPFIFFDLGGDSLEVSVAALMNDGSGPRCRLLGYAIEQVGGAQIDQWLCSEVIRRAGFRVNTPDLFRVLLPECEMAKEILSAAYEAAVKPPGKEPVLVTRNEFERLLSENAFYSRITAAIERALAGAFSRGYTESSISAVICGGGGSAIPSVKALLCRRFGIEKISTHPPVDAIVLGAASAERRYPGDVRIRNEYAMRVWDARSAAYSLRTIVRKGSLYPSEGPVARFRIQGTYDGQAQMGISVYEVPSGGNTCNNGRHRELVIQSSGLIRCHDPSDAAGEEQEPVWVNEKSPAFIPADPPALQGEPRFEVWFMIDATRQLLASARDLRTGKMAVENIVLTRLS